VVNLIQPSHSSEKEAPAQQNLKANPIEELVVIQPGVAAEANVVRQEENNPQPAVVLQ